MHFSLFLIYFCYRSVPCYHLEGRRKILLLSIPNFYLDSGKKMEVLSKTTGRINSLMNMLPHGQRERPVVARLILKSPVPYRPSQHNQSFTNNLYVFLVDSLLWANFTSAVGILDTVIHLSFANFFTVCMSFLCSKR